LDSLFHLDLPEAHDDKSKEFLERIRQIREKQKQYLPLFLESQDSVIRHQRCLESLVGENREDLPFQLQRVITKGHEGLSSYSSLLGSIHSSLKRNRDLTEELGQFNSNIFKVANKVFEGGASLQ